jgi:hypothetical protein
MQTLILLKYLHNNFSSSRVELLSPMTKCTFGKIATRHRPGTGAKIERGHHGSSIQVRLAGLDFVRDEFRCHATKEFSLDRSPVAALSTLPIRGIIPVS